MEILYGVNGFNVFSIIGFFNERIKCFVKFCSFFNKMSVGFIM